MTPIHKIQVDNRKKAVYRREAWDAGITSPYRLGRYVEDRMRGVSHGIAIKLQKGKRQPI